MNIRQLRSDFWGYVRVSTEEQASNYSIQVQKEALMAVGVPENQIYEEHGSAAKDARPILDQLQQKMPPNSSLVVYRLDRFSRSTLNALTRIKKLSELNITLIALDMGFQADPSTHKLLTTLLLTLSEYENNLRRSRQRDGIERAKNDNKYSGRKTVLTKALLSKIKSDLKKDITVNRIAKYYSISRPTVYKAIKLIKEASKEQATRGKHVQ